jgi:hypothetical protein
MRKTFVSGLLVLVTPTAAVGAYLLVVLPWQHRWGATDEEVHRTLPGDDQVPRPDMQWTRAITVEPERSLVLGAQEQDEGISWSFTLLYQAFTWAFVLEEVDYEHTRLIMRMRAQTGHTPLIMLANLFIDFGAFFVKRRMLLGIKQRAERLSKQAKEDAGRKPLLEVPVS